jgi:hypothetical protein
VSFKRFLPILIASVSVFSPTVSLSLLSSSGLSSSDVAQATTTVPAPKAFGEFGKDRKNLAPPEAAMKTADLLNRLKPQQKQKLQAILKRYQPQFKALMGQLRKPSSSVQKPSQSTAAAHLGKAETKLAADIKVAGKIDALQKQVEREVATVLTRSQFEVFKAGANPSAAELAKVVEAPKKGSRTTGKNSYYLSLAQSYVSTGVSYAYYQYLYAYYSYIYTGNSNCYASYYYSYYAYAYAQAAQSYLNAGDGYNGYYYSYYAYLYAYYGYQYAYTCYSQTGNVYAYYAYYYGYNAAYYLYYAYYYAYYYYIYR